MAAAAGIYWTTADLRVKRSESVSRSSDPADGSLQGSPPEPAVGSPAIAPLPSLPDFISKYSDHTAAQLERELAALDKLIERKYVALLNARHADGKYTVVRASPAGGDGRYQFTGGGHLFQAFLAVPGTMEIRHYVELPVDEYPGMYALRDEATYLSGLVQEGKANK
jgi:hypothetical protein